MIYSLGASNEVLSLKKNAVYDEIYCYGAYQRDKLRVLPSTRIFTVGNPRFDFLFDGSTSKEYIRQKLGITGNKNVLAWFPTMSGFCSSIGVWDEQIDSLADEYDIFVCPHMFTSEDAIAKLSEKRVRILPNCFSAELMFVADYCLCDYGGAAFSTIYLDNNLILLNVDGVDECRIYGEDSPEFFLRKKLKSYDLGSVDWLRRDLKDKAYWEDQKKVRRELFDKFYSDYRGNTGVYVYKLLRESFHSVR